MRTRSLRLLSAALVAGCTFTPVAAQKQEVPFTTKASDTAPSAALVIGSNTMSAKVGDTVGIGWGGKFATEGAGSHYSAYYCADPSQNAFIRPWMIDSTGGTFYFTLGPELAGCTLVLRYYVHGSDRRSADSTVTLVVAPRP